MTPRLTVICFKWTGWRPLYDARHVNALARMVRAHLHIPYRFVCVTDDTAGIECDTMPLWDDPAVPNRPSHHDSYRRLRLFGDWAHQQFDGYLLSLDLDCVILDDITPLITWDELRLLKGGVCTYNGSMWLHKTGTRRFIYDDFNPEQWPTIAAPLKTAKGKPWRGSDQVWLSYRAPNERMYTAEDGVYRCERYMRTRQRVPDNARIVFFPGLIDKKPWSDETRRALPQIYDRYMQHFTP